MLRRNISLARTAGRHDFMLQRNMIDRTLRMFNLHVAGGVIRKLNPTETPDFARHLLRLDPETRRMRFAGIVTDFFIKAYADRRLPEKAVRLVFVHDHEIRGTAELIPLGGSDPHQAEFAISVERPFQKRGIGRALMDELIVMARNRGLTALAMLCLADNVGMRRLATRLGARFRMHQGEAVGRLDAPMRTVLTLADEAWADGVAMTEMLLGIATLNHADAATGTAVVCKAG